MSIFVASLTRMRLSEFGLHNDPRKRRVAEMDWEWIASEKAQIRIGNYFSRTFYIKGKKRAWLGRKAH